MTHITRNLSLRPYRILFLFAAFVLALSGQLRPISARAPATGAQTLAQAAGKVQPLNLVPVDKLAQSYRVQAQISMQLPSVKDKVNMNMSMAIDRTKQRFAMVMQPQGNFSSTMEVYYADKTAYTVLNVNGKAECKPSDPAGNQINLDELMQQGMSNGARGMNVPVLDRMNGVLLGTESINGIATHHYQADKASLAKINAAAIKQIKDALKKTDAGNKGTSFLSSMRISYTKLEVWVADDGDYATRIKFDYSVSMTIPAGLSGLGNGRSTRMSVQAGAVVDILDLNKQDLVTLPVICTKSS